MHSHYDLGEVIVLRDYILHSHWYGPRRLQWFHKLPVDSFLFYIALHFWIYLFRDIFVKSAVIPTEKRKQNRMAYEEHYKMQACKYPLCRVRYLFRGLTSNTVIPSTMSIITLLTFHISPVRLVNNFPRTRVIFLGLGSHFLVAGKAFSTNREVIFRELGSHFPRTGMSFSGNREVIFWEPRSYFLGAGKSL